MNESKSLLSSGLWSDFARKSATGTSTSFSKQRRIEATVALSLAMFKPTFFSLQECRDSPILAVVLCPEDASILEFCQGSQFSWTLLCRAQGHAADSRHVDDRHIF